MSDPTGTTPPPSSDTPRANSPAPELPPPTPEQRITPEMAHTYAQQAASQNSSSGTAPDGLLTAIQALPEQIVNALREATQPAKSPAATEQSVADDAPPTRTRREKFQEWWGA